MYRFSAIPRQKAGLPLSAGVDHSNGHTYHRFKVMVRRCGGDMDRTIMGDVESESEEYVDMNGGREVGSKRNHQNFLVFDTEDSDHKEGAAVICNEIVLCAEIWILLNLVQQHFSEAVVRAP